MLGLTSVQYPKFYFGCFGDLSIVAQKSTKLAPIFVESTFSICKIGISGLTVTHVDTCPYLVENITISNVETLKVMAKVLSVPKNPDVGHHHI